MPSIEVRIAPEELRSCLKELNKFLNYEENRQLLNNAISYNMAKQPSRYYKLRDEILPEFMGEAATKGLFWFLMGGWMMLRENENLLGAIKQENLRFLNYLFTNYSWDMMLEKKRTINPLGFNSIHFTRGGDNGYNNLTIERNDGEQFLISVNPLSFLMLLHEATVYYSDLLRADERLLSPAESEAIDEIVEALALIRDLCVDVEESKEGEDDIEDEEHDE